MRRTTGLLVLLGLVLVLTSTAVGANPATMESVGIRYEPPQGVHVIYSTGDMPQQKVLELEAKAAVCLSVKEAEAWAKEAGREFVKPLDFPVTVQVLQYEAMGGGRFVSERRGEVVVKSCAGGWAI